jgi:anti-sigma-K factor RskA
MTWIQGRAGARRFPAGRRGHDLRRRISELDTHERALAELAAAVENKFLALGAALQEQAALSGQLVRKGRHCSKGPRATGRAAIRCGPRWS